MLTKYIRVTLVAVMIALVFFATGLLKAGRAFASIEQVERPEEELLILEVRVNGTIRSNGFISYLPEGSPLEHALLPLGALCRLLSFSMEVNPVDGIAEGWFRDEKNGFQLDLNRNIVFVNGKDIALNVGQAESHFEDIYVQASLLQEWFGIEVRPDLSTLRLFIASDKPLPFEEELARKERGNALSGIKGSNNAFEYTPDKFLPYQWWSYPSVVVQESVQARRDPQSNFLGTNFSVQAQSDAFKFGSKLLLSGSVGTDSQLSLDNASLSFQKRDPANNMLGALKAGTISFGDINYPDVPLVVGRKRGRGVSISSESRYGIAHSFGAETYNIDGDAPLGWDAELYRNGYFVAFQEVGEDGRYNFQDIELVRGFNLFQITLYGPQGQKRTETQRIVRGAEMLRKGQAKYDLALGQPDADFLPLTENSSTDQTFGGSGQISYGLRDYLTVGANVFTGSDALSPDVKRQTAAGVSMVTAFLGLKTQGQLMQANEGQSGYNISTTTRLMGANITAGHTAYNGFSEVEKDLLSSSSVSINRGFLGVSADLRASQNKYQAKEDELILDGAVSTRFGPLQMTNSMQKIMSVNPSQEKFDGDFVMLTGAWDWRLRANLKYDLDHQSQDTFRTAGLSAIKKINNDSTLRLNGGYDFSTKTETADARYSKQFETYAIDVNLGGSSQQNYFGGVTVRTGFQPDLNGKYKTVSARNSGLGSVGLRTYIDENGNKQYDAGEKLISNISFRSNRGQIDGVTDETGILFVGGLSENITRFAVDEESLPSIFIKPYDNAVDIIPRTGATTTIDMGFVQLGEVDGFVFMADQSGEKKAVPGLEIILTNADTGEEVAAVSTEFDGYYIFSGVSLGRYFVKAVPLWGDQDASPVSVELTNAEPVAMDVNINLPAMQDMLGAVQAEDALVEGLEPASGGDEHIVVKHIIDDEPLPVITDGLDIATGEALRGVFIHLGSLSSFEAAQDEQERLWERYADILGDIPLYIYKIQVGDKVYHRIIGAITEKSQGKDLCDALLQEQAAGGCSVVSL